MRAIRIPRRLTPAAVALAAFAVATPVSAVRADDSGPIAGPARAGHDHSQMQGASGQDRDRMQEMSDRDHGQMAAMSGQGYDHAQGMSPEQHQQMMQRMMGSHGHGHGQRAEGTPTLPGQDAFGAIQEVVRIFEADPKTDWSKVDLEALRQHLIDMNEVTLKADAAAKPIDGGLEIALTGSGHTLAAIQRMIPAHAAELNRMNGWSAKTETLPNGVRLTVTASDAKEVAHIRGLGFIGLLASGSHHQPHHLAMATGEFSHRHE